MPDSSSVSAAVDKNDSASVTSAAPLNWASRSFGKSMSVPQTNTEQPRDNFYERPVSGTPEPSALLDRFTSAFGVTPSPAPEAVQAATVSEEIGTKKKSGFPVWAAAASAAATAGTVLALTRGRGKSKRAPRRQPVMTPQPVQVKPNNTPLIVAGAVGVGLIVLVAILTRK